jgi:hypothetical protein
MPRPPLPTKTLPMRSRRPGSERAALAPLSVEQSLLRSSPRRSLSCGDRLPVFEMQTNARACENKAEFLVKSGATGEQCVRGSANWRPRLRDL